MRIGICERGWAAPNKSAPEVVGELIRVAGEIEAMGFDKLWLTEHHTRDYAWTLPDVLVSAIAAVTRRIVIGIGGVLLSSRNPYRTALDVALLDAVAPGRFDFGIGRAPANTNHRCLSGDDDPPFSAAVAARYLQRAGTLLRCLGFPVDGVSNASAHHGEFRLLPTHQIAPPWLLGSSMGSMTVAARWGLPFGCIDVPSAPAVVERYRQTFRPSPWLAKPRVLVSIIGVSADSEEEALRAVDVTRLEGNVMPRDLVFVRDEAAARFARVVELMQPDEIVYTDCSPDITHRLTSYRAIARTVLATRGEALARTA
jgi:luciferase family oxidoreductase group 1